MSTKPTHAISSIIFFVLLPDGVGLLQLCADDKMFVKGYSRGVWACGGRCDASRGTA